MSGRDLPLSALPPEHNGTRLLKMIQQRHPNYHPALSIADIANDSDVDDELALRAHSTLLKYIEPELRSIQIQADVKETRTIRVSLFESIEDMTSGKEAERINEAKSHAPKLPAVMDVEYTLTSEAVRGE